MEARPCQISEFFNGTKQMLVPLFQRSYEWGPREWDALWADIMEQYENSAPESASSHFTGAIVTAPAKSIPIGVSKFLVIDGQQRLTTIAILLASIRSKFDENSPRYRKITRLLINEDDEGLDYFKLLPTQPDRPFFEAVVEKKPIGASRFGQAFEHFKKKFEEKDSDGNLIELERLADTVQNRLTVVAIHLGEMDDPYLIFESLNAKGAPLTQADLIRNYLLLRLHSNDQQAAYEQSWLPMQSLLPAENLTEFMRQYLMMTGEEVSRSSIYGVLKKRLLESPASSVAIELQRMKQSSVLYGHMVGLKESGDQRIDTALARLRRWEIATANPFILKCLLANLDGLVASDEIAQCLAIIESFAVRRTICGVPTNQLKRIFLSITKDPVEPGISAKLAKTLASGGSGARWPKDEELMEAMLRYKAYAQPFDRCKFLLEAIEGTFGHKEQANFSAATIEHVMPRTLSPDWGSDLGERSAEIHERWLDVLGNLTLTAYNSELSNYHFRNKRLLLQESHYEMNKWIAVRENWSEAELRERTEDMFYRARQIWPRPEQWNPQE